MPPSSLISIASMRSKYCSSVSGLPSIRTQVRAILQRSAVDGSAPIVSWRSFNLQPNAASISIAERAEKRIE